MTDRRDERLAEPSGAPEPVLVELARGFGPFGAALFLGCEHAAADAERLLDAGITTTVTVAVNSDPPPLVLADGTPLRRFKVGLIDGPGNPPGLLVAAVLTLASAFALPSPGKPDYPPHRAGGVLVHCRGGRSRSTTVAALFLAVAAPERWTDFGAALADVRAARGLDPGDPGAPRRELLDLATLAADHLRYLHRPAGSSKTPSPAWGWKDCPDTA